MMKAKNLCGKRVKLARIGKDMKQVDLSAALSVDHGIEISQKAISRLERGVRPVSDIELVSLAKLLDVTTSWLLFGENSKP
jgi:transcriptional regulator with XRE-family HTH domain